MYMYVPDQVRTLSQVGTNRSNMAQKVLTWSSLCAAPTFKDESVSAIVGDGREMDVDFEANGRQF